MENYQFFTLIGMFIALIGMMATGFGWIIARMLKMQKEMSAMHIELLKEIRGLDSRIAHIEGYLIGAGQKTGTEKK